MNAIPSKSITLFIGLTVLSSAFLLHPLVAGAAAAPQGNQVGSPVRIGWEIRPGSPAGELLPSGPSLTQHQGYLGFKSLVKGEILAQVPEATRNAWPFRATEVDVLGHKPESSVRDYLKNVLVELNSARSEYANENSLPTPPDLSLTTEEPFSVVYTYNNNTQTCAHKYGVSMGGVPWTVTDSAIPATADFFVQLSWDTRLDQ